MALVAKLNHPLGTFSNVFTCAIQPFAFLTFRVLNIGVTVYYVLELSVKELRKLEWFLACITTDNMLLYVTTDFGRQHTECLMLTFRQTLQLPESRNYALNSSRENLRSSTPLMLAALMFHPPLYLLWLTLTLDYSEICYLWKEM